MRVSCPTNPQMHKQFITRFHVVVDYLVDEKGGRIREVAQLEANPVLGLGNVWTCAVCGVAAKVEEG